MTPEEIQKRIEDLEREIRSFKFINRFQFNKDISIGQNARILGAIFPGSVASDGSTVHLPTGWTATRTATGKYTVTHNLNLTRYVVLASPSQNLATELDTNTPTSTAFKVETRLDLAFADCGFNFLVMLY